MHTMHTNMNICECMMLLFHAVEHILDHYWDQFRREVDANAIVFELEHRDIISDGDRIMISKTSGMTSQNEVLHSCLKKSCNKEAFMEVCDVIVAVKGNRRMKELGKEMQNKLAGIHIVVCMCVCGGGGHVANSGSGNTSTKYKYKCVCGIICYSKTAG